MKRKKHERTTARLSASQSNDRQAQRQRKGFQQHISFAKLGLCAIIFRAIIGCWFAGSSTNAKALANGLKQNMDPLQSETKFRRNRHGASSLLVKSPERELPRPLKGLKVKNARNQGCRVGGIAFEGDGAASSEALKHADWYINTAGSTGPTGFGGLNIRGSVGIHFLGRGVARVKVEVLSAISIPSFTFSLNEANIVTLPPGTRCTMALSYRNGDVFKIASQTDSGTGLKVESLELSAHTCDKAPIRDRKCRAFERVRLPWTDCNDGAQLQRRITRWVEGRLSKIVDSSRAIVSVPLMPAPSRERSNFTNADFDPTSKLVSYVDQGTCGPRGNNAVADLAVCLHGSRMIAQELQEGYQVIATVNGCNYFEYTVYACVEESVSQGGRMIVGTSLVSPLPSEDEVEEDDDSIAASATCPGFLNENRTIAIVIISDDTFQRSYSSQIQTLRCYAEKHGYLLKILNGTEYPECYQYDFFFKKHCTVASWLGNQGPNLVAAIVDADVVVAVPDRGLEKWANHDADVQLYERCLMPEITAGNYMVKNSQFARSFLKQWANYFHIRPPGFSSSDNGAIHLVVHETVQAVNYEKCLAMYRSLKSSVMNLTDYFNFVKCSTDAIGPGRDWRTHGGILTIWPRFNFWVVDGVDMSKYAHAERGPTMHHGIKDANAVAHYYKNVSKCLLNTNQVLKSDGMIQQQMTSMAQAYPNFFAQGTECRGTARRQCPFNCLPTFSCTPLGDHEKPLPSRSCTDCG